MLGHRVSAAGNPLDTWRADLPHRRPGAFGRRLRRSPLEVDGITALLAPIRHAKFASVE
jgi:hypothetical protein